MKWMYVGIGIGDFEYYQKLINSQYFEYIKYIVYFIVQYVYQKKIIYKLCYNYYLCNICK